MLKIKLYGCRKRIFSFWALCHLLSACQSVQYSCPLKDPHGRCLSQSSAYLQSISQEDKQAMQYQPAPIESIALYPTDTGYQTDFLDTRGQWIWILPSQEQRAWGMKSGHYIYLGNVNSHALWQHNRVKEGS